MDPKFIISVVCPICDKGFIDKYHMQRHISLAHLGNKFFGCQYCDGQFSTKDNLKRHIKSIHKGDSHEMYKVFKCSKCGGNYRSESSLTVHMKIHGELRDHKEFAQGVGISENYSKDLLALALKESEINLKSVANLQTAVLVSPEGINMYQCNVCELLFDKFSALSKHVKTHDNSSRPYKCPCCDSAFKLLSHLRRHLKHKHGIKCTSNKNVDLWKAINDPDITLLVSTLRTKKEFDIKIDRNECKYKRKENDIQIDMKDAPEFNLPNETVAKPSMPWLDVEETVKTNVGPSDVEAAISKHMTNNSFSAVQLVRSSEHLIKIPESDKLFCSTTAFSQTHTNITENGKENNSDIRYHKTDHRDALIGQGFAPVIEEGVDFNTKLDCTSTVIVEVPLEHCETQVDDIICSELERHAITTTDGEPIHNLNSEINSRHKSDDSKINTDLSCSLDIYDISLGSHTSNDKFATDMFNLVELQSFNTLNEPKVQNHDISKDINKKTNIILTTYEPVLAESLEENGLQNHIEGMVPECDTFNVDSFLNLNEKKAYEDIAAVVNNQSNMPFGVDLRNNDNFHVSAPTESYIIEQDKEQNINKDCIAMNEVFRNCPIDDGRGTHIYTLNIEPQIIKEHGNLNPENIMKSLKYMSRNFEHKCEDCLASFKTAYSLARHRATHETSRTVFTCDKCGRHLKSITALKVHMKCHLHSAVETCPICGVLLKKISIPQHNCVDTKCHKCRFCENTYKSKSAMYLHVRKKHLHQNNDAITNKSK